MKPHDKLKSYIKEEYFSEKDLNELFDKKKEIIVRNFKGTDIKNQMNSINCLDKKRNIAILLKGVNKLEKAKEIIGQISENLDDDANILWVAERANKISFSLFYQED